MSRRRHRIVHVITGLATGGAQRALANLLEAGLSQEYDNRVVALTGPGAMEPAIERLGVPVTRLNVPRSGWSLPYLGTLRTLLRETDPDIVQGWLYHGNLAASAVLCTMTRRPVLAWNIRHSVADLKIEKSSTRRAIRSGRLLSGVPRAIVYNSRNARLQHENMGYRSAVGRVIPNGFDLNRFMARTESPLRGALGIPADATVVGHIGRYHPMKDHGCFLAGAAAVSARHADAHFVMIGKEVTSGNVELAAQAEGVPAERLHMLGERDDVELLLGGMDLVCSTSAWGEGFSNALGEAMATGLPCIATAVGDSEEVIADTGFVLAPGDVPAFIEALDRMLSLSRQRRSELGKAARRRVEKHFSIGSVLSQYDGLYQYLLRGTTGGKEAMVNN